MKSIQREPSGFPFDLAKNQYDQNKVEKNNPHPCLCIGKVYFIMALYRNQFLSKKKQMERRG